MKRKIATVILGIFLIGIASAGLLDSFGRITGSVEVKGPVFYTASSNELIINEKPSSGNWNIISNGPYVKREWVMSKENSLGGIDFYKPEINFVVNLKIGDDFNVPRGIGLEFGYYDSNDNKKTICSTKYLSITKNGTIEIPCPLINYEEDNPQNIERFYYSFEPLSNKKYTIFTKDTYVEIIGVVKETGSNETINPIPISKATHLNQSRQIISDIYEQVKAKDNNWSEQIDNNEYVRVTFEENLTNKNDITIYARSENNTPVEIKVYTEDSTEIIAKFENITNENWYTIYLTNLPENESYNIFDLKSIGNIEYNYISDPLPWQSNSTIISENNTGENFNFTEFVKNSSNNNETLNNHNGTQGSENESVEVFPFLENATETEEIEESNATESSLEQPVTEKENIEPPIEQSIAPTEEITQEKNKNTETILKSTFEFQTEKQTSEINSQDNENNEEGKET